MQSRYLLIISLLNNEKSTYKKGALNPGNNIKT